MGIFDNWLGNQGSERLSLDHREAFASVLLITVAADGSISDDEARGFNAIINRMQLYREQSGDQFSAMMDKLLNLLKKRGADFLLPKAIEALPAQLRETAFANAADLVFADGSVEAEEKELLEKLYRVLQLPDQLAAKIIEVVAIKNRG